LSSAKISAAAEPFSAGLALYLAGEPEAAAARFAEALALAPDHADALRLRGLAMVRAGRVPDPWHRVIR